MEEDHIRSEARTPFRRIVLAVLAIVAVFAFTHVSDQLANKAMAMSSWWKASDVADKAEKKAAQVAQKADEASGGVKVDEAIKVAASSVHEKTLKEVENIPTVAVIAIPHDYENARWHPIHFKPAIDSATNKQCLACHKDILTRKPRETSPAGVKAKDALAWYQTLDTYKGEQSTFHARHMTSDYAKQVMDLKCTFCHQGNDPREEVPGSHKGNVLDTSHVMRKSVDPEKTCLMCHGKFPYENMVGLEGPWHEARKDMEDPEDPDMRNGCMTCHGETYRTVRHQVNFLKAENIEKLAKEGSSDTCYGCHGGRQWYRMNYPYPRHKWPGMEDVIDEMPEWAKNRPTESDPRYKRAGK